MVIRLIDLKEVIHRTNLSRTQVYKAIWRDTFPKPVKIGKRKIAFVEEEIENWILARISERD